MDGYPSCHYSRKKNVTNGAIEVIAHVKGVELSANSSEKNFNNEQRTLQGKYFKEIITHLQNATQIHITGTGQVQEQFIHYLAADAPFKNTATTESTSNKMTDEKLKEFMAAKLS